MWFRRRQRAEADFSIFLPSVSHVLFARSIGCGETHELPRQRAIGRDKDVRSTNEQTKSMAVMVATAVVLMDAHMARGLRLGIGARHRRRGACRDRPALFCLRQYATLGYVTLRRYRKWRLKGPMTAMNGMLRRTIEHLAAIGAPCFSRADRS